MPKIEHKAQIPNKQTGKTHNPSYLCHTIRPNAVKVMKGSHVFCIVFVQVLEVGKNSE